MGAKEKIKVLIIENSESAVNDMKRVFKANDKYELVYIRSSARDSDIMEPTREKQKTKILNLLQQMDYQILIFDLLLRDKTEIEPESLGEDFSGCENILSLEIARELKAQEEFSDIMIVFTSSSGVCSTHDRFESMRETFPDQIPKDFYFIFKPERDGHEIVVKCCPVYREDHVGECGKKDGIRACASTRDKCFVAILDKYYEDFRKDRGYAE